MVSFVSNAQRSDCGVNPSPNAYKQANGSIITLNPLGTESVNYLESNEGYTLLFNKESSSYEYAKLDEKGNLSLSGITAADNKIEQLGKNGIIPHLRYSSEQVNLLRQYFNEQTRVEKEMGKAGANVFPAFGDRKVLVLMVQYPDLNATIPASNFELLMNQPGNAGTGSFRDYYLSGTKNRFRLTGDIYGWFMADSGYKYYGKTSSPSYGTATRKLLVGAILDADSAGVDFTKYDSDSDGYVDAVILIHAGQGAEESSAPNSGNYIWSFRSTLPSSSSPTCDGKKFSAYCMFPEKLYNSGNPVIVGIGVIAHEFGHIIDLPDLYSTSYNNSGAGNYTIMAAGTWLNGQKTPAIFDAYSRTLLNWNTTKLITEVGNYTIPYSVADSNFAFRINTKRTNEYFLLENRQLKGFDRYIPSKGLAIWRVNTQYAGRLSTTGNNANNDTSSMGLQLIQADGLREMERNINNGNGGDLFPGTTNNKNWTPFTKPSSALQTTYEPSNIYITNITMNPDSSISFRFSSQPSAAFSMDRFSGCSPMTLQLTNNSTAAYAFKWDFGNGDKDSLTLNPKKVFTTPGTYYIKLTVYDSVGTASDSSTLNIEVYPSPKASFTNIQNGNKLTLINTSTGSTSVQWQYVSGGNSYSSSSNQLKDIEVPDSGKFTYQIIAFNNYGCADTAYGFTYAFPTSVKNEDGLSIDIKAIPNPFRSELRIELDLVQANELSFELTDITGRIVSVTPSAIYSSGKQTIRLYDAESLHSGVYFLNVKSGNQLKTVRLIKTE